jgi:hypothetical protein
MQKTIFLFCIVIYLTANYKTIACTCDTTNDYFASSIPVLPKKGLKSDGITSIKYLNTFEHGGRFLILDLIFSNNANLRVGDTITIWGDSGNLCRISFENTFRVNDTIVTNLVLSDTATNQYSPNAYREKASDYMMPYCDKSYMIGENNSFSGFSADQPKVSLSELKEFYRDGLVSFTETMQNKVFCSPNPFSDSFKIKPGLPVNLIEVLDVHGKCVISLKPHAKIFEVNMLNLIAGQYTIKIYLESGTVEFHRVVKL